MSTLPTVDPQISPGMVGPPAAGAPLVICLPSMTADATSALVARLSEMFAGESLLIASPDQAEEYAAPDGALRMLPYPLQRGGSDWVLRGSDYRAAARLAEGRGASGVILLGTEAGTIGSQALLELRNALTTQADLAIPRYRTGENEGLVTSSLLYPLTRALFGVDTRFPLPLDAALSSRMLNRLAAAAARLGPQTEEGLIWPVSEAAVAGFTVRQLEGGERTLPRPQEDLNIVFPAVTSSIFADLENKATFWQRARTLPAPRPSAAVMPGLPAEGADEIRSLVDGFRLAFTNLREIWSLVLPPQSLLSLKKLSMTPAESFAFPPSLWARTVYDFALAFHLRTLNRGHLLGALTPLYLGWVGSFLRQSEAAPGRGGELLESTASAFEQEKPYLVSRWRWPDRFNP